MAGAPIRVLIVEDHEHVLWGLGKLITAEWPRMVLSGSARTVAEARLALRKVRPDVVVLDLFLGEQNALEHLPPQIAAAGAALVVLTGCREPELRRRAMESGACACVLKEAPAEELLFEIARAHRGRRTA
jgi:DNA-binding NarL/FixJ family response regulator